MLRRIKHERRLHQLSAQQSEQKAVSVQLNSISQMLACLKLENVLIATLIVFCCMRLLESYRSTPEYIAAASLIANKSYREALPHLERSIASESNRALAYVLRACAYDGLGKYGQAINDCNRAIALNPFEPRAWTKRAFAYIGLGRYSQAVDDCDQAISIDPKLYQAYQYRAEAYRKSGRSDLAERDSEKARELRESLSFRE